MRLRKYMLIGAVALAPMALLSSCGNDDEEPLDPNDPDAPSVVDPDTPSTPGNTDIPSDPSDVDDPVGPSTDEKPSSQTPEESKQSIESTGVKASELFKADDQKPVVDWANEFSDDFGDFDMPSQWDDEFDIESPVRNIRRALVSATPTAITRAANVYIYNFGKFTGEFVPGNGEWVKKADSKDIVFSYTNRAGQPVVMTITAEGSNKEFEVNVEDYDYYDNEYYNETYKITAPKRVTFTVKSGSTTLVNTLVVADVNEDAHTVNAQVKGQIANLGVDALLTAIDSKIVEKAVISVGNTQFVASSAEVNGKNLATRSSIENLVDHPDASHFDAMFTNALANVNVLGELQVRASGSKVGEIIRAFDTDKCWDNYDYPSKEAARQDCQSACDVANRNVIARMYLNGSGSYVSTVKLTPVFDSWGGSDWWEWYVEPMLYFNDGTSYTFEGYFGNGRFTTVEDAWSNVWESYEKLWR